ncbi:HAD family hydrolase [Streptomyces sp. ACA25]|uniref:HAD family hydrolase n=1 Tax=Streptomyces sp. ACA25 TaxID=3022596 RepID=UPI002307F60A|nr:HAD family hydrolase [Streptomyces sp. ACA25]MDB1087762.1 HAD family hydrolase [Streptomyces sp. ACA25]
MTAPGPPAQQPPAAPQPAVLVGSDLDRTLIYSAAALALGMPDADAPRLLCVEVYRGKPLSYLTETAAALLADLAARTVFVPCTTRTREQYHRISLPVPVPEYAICANGGHLLVRGETDHDWHRGVRRTLAADCAPLPEIRDRMRSTAGSDWLLNARTAEDLFCYLVLDRDRFPAEWATELAAWAEPRGWRVSLQGRKLYAVPRPLTKSAALAEVARRSGAGEILTAGDSLLDADLLLAADHGWRPGHGELAAVGWSAPHVTALPGQGVSCGEEVLRAMLRHAAGSSAPAAAPPPPHASAAPHRPDPDAEPASTGCRAAGGH